MYRELKEGEFEQGGPRVQCPTCFGYLLDKDGKPCKMVDGKIFPCDDPIHGDPEPVIVEAR